MLAERLNRALSVYQHQTDKCKILLVVVKGQMNPYLKALAMQRYLIQHGVPNLVLLWNLNRQIRLKTSIIQKSYTTYTQIAPIYFVLRANFISYEE